MNRPICQWENCSNKAALHNTNKKTGKKYFKKFCAKHSDLLIGEEYRQKRRLKIKALLKNIPFEELKELNLSKCSLCGWNRTTCDIHRIILGKVGGKYKKENIIILCPNCHRLIHRNLIKI